MAFSMEGKVFGLLTVIRKAEERSGSLYWLCCCSCGVEKEIRGTALRSGHTKSCGCQQSAGRKARDSIAGMKFGRLTAIREASRPADAKAKGKWWLCKCDCGEEISVRRGLLISGNNRSCGCLKRKNPQVTRCSSLAPGLGHALGPQILPPNAVADRGVLVGLGATERTRIWIANHIAGSGVSRRGRRRGKHRS